MKWIKYMIIPVLLGLMLVASTGLALTVAPSKTTYYPGEQLVISGTATPNALVSIVVYNPLNQLVALDQVKAGDDGSFTKAVLTFPSEPTNTLPLGTYTVIVKDTATNEEKTIHVTLEQPKAIITGTVVSSEGAPIPKAIITVKMGDVIVLVGQADSNGNFAATVYDTGNYTVIASAEGYESASVNVIVSELPSTQSVQIVLKKQTLSVKIESLKVNGIPLTGVAREGDTLVVEAKVKFGDAELSNATVKGYLTSSVREAAGLPPLEFELTYSSEVQAYVGSVSIPAPGVDRTCTVKVEATYNDYEAVDSASFITLVGTPKNIEDVQGKIANITAQINSLQKTIEDLQSNLNNLQNTVNTLQAALSTLQTTVTTLQGQIGSLAGKQDLANLQNQLNQLQSQIEDMQNQINSLQQQVNSASGAKSVAYGAIAIGIIAIIIAIAALAYLNKKIQG